MIEMLIRTLGQTWDFLCLSKLRLCTFRNILRNWKFLIRCWGITCRRWHLYTHFFSRERREVSAKTRFSHFEILLFWLLPDLGIPWECFGTIKVLILSFCFNKPCIRPCIFNKFLAFKTFRNRGTTDYFIQEYFISHSQITVPYILSSLVYNFHFLTIIEEKF